MSSKQINQLPSGIANPNAVVAADNEDLTVTEKILLGDIAKLATSSDVTYDNTSSNLSATNVKAALDELAISHAHDDRYYTASEIDKLVGTSWQQLGNDLLGVAAGAWSGYAVALSRDGQKLVVGAPTDGVTNTTAAGVVKVYEWDTSSWVQIGADITGDYIGHFVATNDAGDMVAVSGFNAETFAGYVRVYAWNGTSWVQVGADIVDETPGDQSVAVSLDAAGTVLAVGGKYNSAAQQAAGHVRVFSLVAGAWVQQGADIDGAAAIDFFGQSVSLNSSGSTLAVGAVSPFSFGGQGAGYASVYSWNGTTWLKRGTDIVGEANDDHSGVSVSISSDGNTVAIGAHWNDDAGIDAGHVRVYFWNGTAWSQRGADIDGESAGAENGWMVSLSGDGYTVAIGSPERAQIGGLVEGKVAVYSWRDSNWQLSRQTLSGSPGSALGLSVSLSRDGNVLAAGGPFADNSTGYVRVFGATAAAATLVAVPASATAPGVAGQIAYDGDYIYICTATDVWKRVAIGTW